MTTTVTIEGGGSYVLEMFSQLGSTSGPKDFVDEMNKAGIQSVDDQGHVAYLHTDGVERIVSGSVRMETILFAELKGKSSVVVNKDGIQARVDFDDSNFYRH